MHRDYVGLASIFLRLAMAPDAMIGSSEIGCQDQGAECNQDHHRKDCEKR